MYVQFDAWLVMRILKELACLPESVDDYYPDVGRWSISVAQIWKTQDSGLRAFVKDALDDLGARVSKSDVLNAVDAISVTSSSTSGACYDELLREVIRNVLGGERVSRLFEVWEVRVEVEVDPAGAFLCTPHRLGEPIDTQADSPPTIAPEDSQISDECESFNRQQERREAEFAESMRRWASEVCDELRKSQDA